MTHWLTNRSTYRPCDKKIGAAAVTMKNGRVKKSLRYHLGDETEHTVYEAEALAVILALLKRRIRKVKIGMDNQAVLLGMRNKTRTLLIIMDKIHDALEDFQVMQARKRGERIEGYRRGAGRTRLEDGSVGWKDWGLKMRCRAEFVWTPGHEGIDGNERADEEAKQEETPVRQRTFQHSSDGNPSRSVPQQYDDC